MLIAATARSLAMGAAPPRGVSGTTAVDGAVSGIAVVDDAVSGVVAVAGAVPNALEGIEWAEPLSPLAQLAARHIARMVKANTHQPAPAQCRVGEERLSTLTVA